MLKLKPPYMKADNELTGILNDLIRINHDRTEGYQKAIEALRPADIDLNTMFTNAASASVQNANALAAEVRNLGADPATDTTQSGKIYRIWMDIRSGISIRDRKSALSLCEFGEDAALRAYKLALESDVAISRDIRKLIEEQKDGMQAMHDTVKRYRDMHEAINS
jgi:uncharacterized protein (TIGR02284 family)